MSVRPELEGRQQISIGGGYRPAWSADGSEIVYIRVPNGPPEAVMRVTIDVASEPSSLSVSQPEELFDFVYDSRIAGQRYCDVSPDTERFLVITLGSGDVGSAREINVVLHWFEELKERVPLP